MNKEGKEEDWVSQRKINNLEVFIVLRGKNRIVSLVVGLCFMVAGVFGAIPSAMAHDDDVSISTVSYGTSGMGRPLYVTKFEPEGYTHKVLCVFEIHGYEDFYAKDGQKLVDLANGVIDDFIDDPGDLEDTALYIVASANPDGLIDGTTNNGPGRCQVSMGVDINRDFDWNYQAITPQISYPRNYTPSAFSCPESQALRDLVWDLDPDDVVDFHGWFANYGLGFTRGDRDLAHCFNIPCSLYYVAAGANEPSGQFYGWAGTQVGRSTLVELSNPYTVTHNNITDGILNIIDAL